MNAVLRRGYRDVIVLNYDHQILGFVTWKRARSLVATGRAALVKAASTAAGAVRYLVIRFLKMVRQFYGKRVQWKTRNVLIRDRFICQYCGGHATTVDHVMPRSRGGKDSWDNSAAACSRCNNSKDNRTPAEAGMFLARRPYAPTIMEFMLGKISLMGLDGFVAELFSDMANSDA